MARIALSGGAGDGDRIRRLVEAEARRRLDQLVKASALEGERFAKQKAVEGGSHRRGTPTPATRGRGPAKITGNLQRSITSSVDSSGRTPEAKVGLAPSGAYGEHVEALGYPFISLVPEQLRTVIVPRLAAQLRAKPWPKFQ